MDQYLIEALNERDTVIIEKQKSLMKEYEELEDERQHVAALLEKYRALSTNTAPPSPAFYQEGIPSDHSQNTKQDTQVSSKYKFRQSPGEVEKYIDHVLMRGEHHSIVSLVRRIDELLGIKLSDSTIGVTLRRGLSTGKYKQDVKQWSMVLDQNKPAQQPEKILIDHREKEGMDDERPFLVAMKIGDFENNV